MMNTAVRIVRLALLPAGILLVAGCGSGNQPAESAATEAPETAPKAAMDYDHDVTREEFEQLMTDLSNWNRWGEADELGAVNLITPEKVRDAAKLVAEGVTVSMEHPLLTEAAPDNSDPFVHEMTATGANPVLDAYAMDRYEIFYHGYGHTHLDALGHAFWEGKMYNGHPQEEVTAEGAQAMDITVMRNGIVTRGVIVDIPWLKGIPYLEPGTPIYPEDLDAWEQKTGVTIGPGDAVFVRTGRWARREALGPWNAGAESAGLHVSTVPWFKARDISFIGGDGASDLLPSQVEGVSQPVHFLMLIAMGTPMFDNCDLEAVTAKSQELGRYTFMFSAAPLAVPGGTGSPINPIAVF